MKIHFHVSLKPKAQKALKELRRLYDPCEPEEADVIVVLGGDGMMLRALHSFAAPDKPLYGMNLGTLGFLLNEFRIGDLEERLEKAEKFVIHPLRMTALDSAGTLHKEIAFNEVSLLRETHSAAKIRISAHETVRIPELICDGVLVSTPVGSTAYNSSAGGPIVPLDANVLPLTPISPFRPRRWSGALVRNDTPIRFEVLEADERPVSATADSKEIREVVRVDIRESRSIARTLLFDPDNHLAERISQEQFAP